jgi:predicted ATPase
MTTEIETIKKPQILKIELGPKISKRVSRRKTISFEPGINLLIGPNGSGKSTILRSIRDWKREKPFPKVSYNPGRLFSFDFEKDNPRTKGHFGNDFEFQVASMFSSHGETTKGLLHFLVDSKSENAVFLLDEPEQALDIDGLNNLVSDLKISSASQIIIATHSPFLILQKEFHVIEIIKGYRKKIRDALLQLL